MVLNCKVSLLFFSLFTLSFLNGFAADSLRTEKVGDRYYVIHRVEKGETLYSLSRRYNSHLNEIVRTNDIINNNISLGQELKIPIEGNPVMIAAEVAPETGKFHTVMTGETLYAISRRYGVTVSELKKWNNLSSNEISIGQSLRVGDGYVAEKQVAAISEADGAEESVATATFKEERSKRGEGDNVPEGFKVYYVQNGELLGSIARKFNVRPDSIIIWNDLQNTYLSIGQRLLIKGEIDREYQKKVLKVTTTSYGTIRKSTDQSGFTKIYEEGIASKIDSSVETDKYLALHRTLPMGTLIEVRNLMNNQKVFVRVVGKLPETGLNENVLVRLTPVCFERLGVIDPKARVEVSYYEE